MSKIRTKSDEALERAKFLQAVRTHAGVPALVARELKVTRAAAAAMITADPEARKIIEEQAAVLEDIARAHVMQGVQSGDKGAVRSFLGRLGAGATKSDNLKRELTPEECRALATCWL